MKLNNHNNLLLLIWQYFSSYKMFTENYMDRCFNIPFCKRQLYRICVLFHILFQPGCQSLWRKPVCFWQRFKESIPMKNTQKMQIFFVSIPPIHATWSVKGKPFQVVKKKLSQLFLLHPAIQRTWYSPSDLGRRKVKRYIKKVVSKSTDLKLPIQWHKWFSTISQSIRVLP